MSLASEPSQTETLQAENKQLREINAALVHAIKCTWEGHEDANYIVEKALDLAGCNDGYVATRFQDDDTSEST